MRGSLCGSLRGTLRDFFECLCADVARNMFEPIFSISPKYRQKLVSALETGLLEEPYTEIGWMIAIGDPSEAKDILTALNAASEMGISSKAIAAWIKSIEKLLLEIEDRKPRYNRYHANLSDLWYLNLAMSIKTVMVVVEPKL